MAKVRIHALAKEIEVQSKEVMSFLAEKNIEVKSVQSTVEDDVIAMVKSHFSGKTTAAKPQKDPAKAPAAATKKKTSEATTKKKASEVATKPKAPKADEVAASKASEAASKASEVAPEAPETVPAKAPETTKENGEVVDRPKKKSSISAVFNPQNSKMSRQQQQRGPRSGGRQDGGNRSYGQGQQNRLDNRPQRSGAERAEAVKAKFDKLLAGDKPESKTEPVKQAAPEQTARPSSAHNYTGRTIQEYVARPQQNNTGEQTRTVHPDQNRTMVRPDQNRTGARTDQNRYNNDNRGTRPDQNRTGTRPDQNRTGARPDQNRTGARPDQNRTGARPDQNRTGARPDQNRYNNDNRGVRPDQNRTGVRPDQNRTGNRPGGQSAGGRTGGYNRPQGGQGGQSGQRPAGNYPRDQRNRLEHEITKLNQSTSGTTEEPRKEVRRSPGQKPDKSKKYEPKRQERVVNLEKNGGKKRKPQPAPAPVEKVEDVIRTIVIPEKMTVKELADKMKVPASAIVKKLFLQGVMVTVNQEVDFEKAEEIALEFNCICEMEEKIDVIEELLREEEEDESMLVKRPPVVCVMGHVDHGKTSLLDAIRNTHVIDKEAGGITQHIGAYMVTCNGEKITFLDTPGHEAFTAMRMRGANATDIAILVVAADDGVMPQTVEAISHAKAAGVEIIVAINKIDKPSANIERVKQELSEYELIPEDWGGSTIFVPVSAHTHEGIDNLLEMILLTAEVGELKANPKRLARGLVIEAQLDKGRGAVATILVQKGTLRVGEPIAAGSCSGKIRAMIDDKGKRVKEAGPSTPVEILGLNNVPNAGEVFVCTESEKEAKSFADTFISQGREKLLEDTKAKMSLDDLFTQIQSGNVKELGIIVKADVQGSVEAVKQSLTKLSNEEVVVKVIHGGVGAINESDVSLASASNAIIIGFNVRPDAQAKATADREGVDLRLYKVIYNAIEDVQAAMKGMLDPIFEEKVLGHAEVRQIFKASGIGNIAGSYVLDGMFQRGCKVRITREGEQIFEGNLASLKRFKDDVKEVKTGFECGLVFEGFDEIQELDIVEAYTMVEVPR